MYELDLCLQSKAFRRSQRQLAMLRIREVQCVHVQLGNRDDVAGERYMSCLNVDRTGLGVDIAFVPLLLLFT